MKNNITTFLEWVALSFDTLKVHVLGAISFMVVWLSPIHFSIGIVLLAISTDTLAGRWAARCVAEKEGQVVREVVTSRKTREGFVSKVFQYIGGIILTFLLDSLLLHDLVSFFFPTLTVEFFSTKLLAFIFVAIEFDSFDEKYYRVKGKSIKAAVVLKLKKIKTAIFEIINIKRDL